MCLLDKVRQLRSRNVFTVSRNGALSRRSRGRRPAGPPRAAGPLETMPRRFRGASSRTSRSSLSPSGRRPRRRRAWGYPRSARRRRPVPPSPSGSVASASSTTSRTLLTDSPASASRRTSTHAVHTRRGRPGRAHPRPHARSSSAYPTSASSSPTQAATNHPEFSNHPTISSRVSRSVFDNILFLVRAISREEMKGAFRSGHGRGSAGPPSSTRIRTRSFRLKLTSATIASLRTQSRGSRATCRVFGAGRYGRSDPLAPVGRWKRRRRPKHLTKAKGRNPKRPRPLASRPRGWQADSPTGYERDHTAVTGGRDVDRGAVAGGGGLRLSLATVVAIPGPWWQWYW